jgi:Zn-dependent protease with chaperone function
MPQAVFLYPATPPNVPAAVTQPSPSFKKGVSGVMGSIVLFFVVYIILFIFSIALVAACIYGGIALIASLPGFITIAAGIGLFGVGLMVFIFLIKFLFAVSRYDRSGMIEITEADQPQLFAFIRQLTVDTQTKFPRRIYLSPDVNASVFYDSSFWSMFFPVKKNLQIGLGLVNAVNISEFKAVMAHEFGHFSQRSMKLGSFVYNVNRVIHNMLYENKSYGGFLEGWANVDGIFAFFASITIRIAQAIQWILRQVYTVINKNYMRLSREMEFHADAVAASVSGTEPMVTALRRVELAGSGYSIALQKCDDLFRDKKKSQNIYKNQKAVLQQLADEFKLPLEQGLPVVNNEFLQSNNLSRVNFKDQWASHPTMNDREKHLRELAIPTEILKEPAWIIFSNREQLETQLTAKIYEPAPGQQEAALVDEKVFEEKMQGDIQRFTLPALYNGFYDSRQVSVDAGTQAELLSGTALPKFEELFTSQQVALPKKVAALNADIELLKAIAAKQVQAKTFDFDGVKYNNSEATTVATQLEKELKTMQAQLDELDASVIGFFYDKAGKDSHELKANYNNYFSDRRRADQFLSQINEMLASLQPLYIGKVSGEQVNVIIDELKSNYEQVFKNNLQAWLQQGAFDNDPAVKKNAELFVAGNYRYFTGTEFINRQLHELNDICSESWMGVSNYLFGQFKSILEKQLELIKN